MINVCLKYIFLFYLLNVFLTASGQFLDTAYIFTYGGPGHDHCREIEPTSDGGFILVGATGSFGNGNSDIYLVKIDSNCIHQWSKAIGGTNVEWGYSVKQTFDNGYIIAGYTNSFGAGGYDVYLVKTDSLGDTLWTKTYGGSDWDFGYSIQITPDSGFIICGETYSFGNGNADVYVVKTNESGDILWTKAFGGTDTDIGHSIIVSNDSNYVIVGETSSFGLDSSDVYLLKIDQNGDTVWTKRYGGTNLDVGYNLEQTSDNGYIIIGTTMSYGYGKKDAYLVKTDSIGIFEWQDFHGGNEDDEGRDIIQLGNNGFFLVGSTKSFGMEGSNDLYIVQTNSIGGWQAGSTFGDADTEEGFSLTYTNDSGLIFAGYSKSYGQGNAELFVVKFDDDSLVVDFEILINNYNDSLPSYTSIISNSKDRNNKEILIYPNPFVESTTIVLPNIEYTDNSFKFSIFTLLGKKVYQIDKIYNNHIILNKGKLTKGLYIYVLFQNEMPLSKGKLVVK